jgi:enoyl-CoA hydratase/carnithine racemase
VDEQELVIERNGPVALLAFNRPQKRNAINDKTLAALRSFFADIPEDVRVIVLSGNGGHFSSGLDLSEQVAREPHAVMRHSRNWHSIVNLLRHSGIPVVAALSGAVMGGGLELASACHVRVAQPGVMYRMPEGQRGIFVGGGGTVHLAGIIGADKMTEMMLTGRTYSAEDGERLGISHYLAEADGALALARQLAQQIASNSPTVNYLIVQSIARIAHMSSEDGLYTESLAAALSQTGADAEEGLRAFLEKRPPNFNR